MSVLDAKISISRHVLVQSGLLSETATQANRGSLLERSLSHPGPLGLDIRLISSVIAVGMSEM